VVHFATVRRHLIMRTLHARGQLRVRQYVQGQPIPELSRQHTQGESAVVSRAATPLPPFSANGGLNVFILCLAAINSSLWLAAQPCGNVLPPKPVAHPGAAAGALLLTTVLEPK
jgi:hypothetical protein